MPRPPVKNFSKKFSKSVDKLNRLCYNKSVERNKSPKGKERKKMKKYTVRNIYNNKTEVVVTDEKGIANVVLMGYDVVKVEEVEG